MTSRGRHPQKPKMRLSQKERDIADVATFQLWSSSDDYNRYIQVKHELMAKGMEREAAEGEAVRVVKEKGQCPLCRTGQPCPCSGDGHAT